MQQESKLAFAWPSTPPFDPQTLRAWGRSRTPLAQALPDFSQTGGATLGAGGDDRYMRWRQATVIVRLEDGWGSGAFISPDGWLLTNYHVIDHVAQAAAVSGEAAIAEIITPRIVDGRIRPAAPLKARVYRADPTRDLALLKLDALPAGQQTVPYFPMATAVEDGEDCFVIGSQNNGPAWWVRSGNVSQQFDFPEGLSQFAAGVASSSTNIDRDRATVIVTDTRISSGDSGGPLLNAKGELIGLTFATPANRSAGSVGWHIALRHLRDFAGSLPAQPEGVPFDPWTAGLPGAAMLQPEVGDSDRDGRIDSLRYRYAVPSRDEGGADTRPRAVALTVFVDFGQRLAKPQQLLDQVPFGLWGMEDRGRFKFDLFVTTRADDVTVVGHTNAQGVVDDIRVGRARQETAAVVWRRGTSGRWSAAKPAAPVPLLDPSRLNPENMRMLQTIAGSSSPRGNENDGRRPANVIR
jgi:S1-C subfamily serine protease